MIIQDGNNDEFIAIDTRVVHSNISNHFYKKQTMEFLLILPHWKVWEKNIPVSFFFNLDNYSHFKFKIFTLKCH